MRASWKKRLTLAAAVVVLVILAFSPQPGTKEQRPTTFERGPEGLSALYHLSQELGYTTERWRMSWEQLPVESQGVLFVIDPADVSTRRETAALKNWVSRGGTAVLTTESRYLLEDFGLSPFMLKTWTRCIPGALSQWSRGVRRLSTLPENALSVHTDTSAFVPILVPVVHTNGSDTDSVSALGAVGAAAPVGEGWIIVFTSSVWFRNAGIQSHDNSRLAANLLAHESQQVWFDEYHHGFRDGVGAIFLERWPAVMAAVLTVLTALLVLWSRGTRFGAALLPQKDTARQQSEYVDALAHLYDHGKAYHEALEELIDHTKRDIGTRSGALGMPSDERLKELARQRWPEGADRVAGLVDATRSSSQYDRNALDDAARTLETLRRKVTGHD